ncbi:glycosyltransferase family 2 protein [Roseibacillus ishigakijimensis]|uniref:Uncharacterized protein n=1 Tax=Roseibacillus ishigakijimensis TaxID=454146 RepID=A0A934VM79_9BACT|nr:hypothetical protein [Roseibacillus ishigakijimensis]MBK1833675.1 hypothetical protein [Roseibacillus ishigakijimensis]
MPSPSASPPTLPTIGFGVTSWRSPETLGATLDSYRQANFAAYFDEHLLHILDASEEDREVLSAFDFRHREGKNQGIAESMRTIAQSLSTDLVLLLENDCPLIEPEPVLRERLELVRRAFADDQVDIFRLRHRWQVGEMFALRKHLSCHPVAEVHPSFAQPDLLAQYPPSPLRRFLKPRHARQLRGRAVYVERHPEQRFPDVFTKMADEPDEWFVTDSRSLNWTNQSVVVRRDFFLETLMRYVDEHPSKRTSNGFQSPERPLNSAWWREQRFRIGVGTGLFTHERRDGSWRRNHPKFQENAS